MVTPSASVDQVTRCRPADTGNADQRNALCHLHLVRPEDIPGFPDEVKEIVLLDLAEKDKAALDKAERAARRERLGIKENEIPASQVGNRRYARGRAYVADRYSAEEMNTEE